MKKIVLILFVMCFALFSLSAENEMTYEQTRAYNNEALSIKDRSVTYTDGGAYSFGWPDSYYSSSSYISTTSTTQTTWDAYRGAEKISKADFFSLTGYPEYEKMCLEIDEANRKRNSTGLTLSIVGGVAYIAGSVVMLTSIGKTDQTLLYVGAGIAVAGAIPLGIGLALSLTPDSEPDISSSFALSVADLYNKQLMAKIKVSY